MNQLGARGSVETTRRWGPYPYYKDSGVEWLGEIPEHWSIMPIKRIFYILNGSTPKSSEPSYWSGSISWATPDDLGSLETDTLKITKRMITQEGYESCGTQLAPTGSLVLSTRAPIGHLAIAGVPLCINQGCRCLVFREKTQNRFYYYQLLAAKQELESWGQGSTFKELSRDKLVSVSLVSPTLDEQQAITAFLDRETSRIDTLIAKKQRQIELLQEKRTALISHAVTKGLNPDAKMKDSGIEWLGEIPEHWEVNRSKVLFQEVHERSETGEEELLSVSHITGVSRRSEKNVYMFMAESLEGYKKCSQGDLVINTMWAWMGALGITPEDGIVSPSYNVYRLRRAEYDPWFYDYLFRTSCFIAEIICYSKGVWTSRLRLYPQEFFEIRLPCPPLSEQKKIVAAINKETSHYDAFQEKIEQSIEKLQEYRTALISAAVTGKIDVRKEVA